MRVLLVGPDLESNLSLRYLVSSLRAAGHQPLIATFDSAADLPSVLRAAQGTDLIGLSMCFQLRAPEFLGLGAALKEQDPSRPVIAGGHFASCAAAELLEHHPQLDVIVIHEGERAMVELANLGPELLQRAGELQGVAVRAQQRAVLTPARPILDDLDTLPLPDRSGPPRLVAGVPTAYLMGSRGCVNACDYCCITTLHRLAPGKRFRQRSPEHVAGEMAQLFHGGGVRQFVFHDDNFLVPSYAHNHARIEALAAALQRHNVRDMALVLKCSPRDAERRVLVRLKELGLIRIFMGIESGTQCGLDAIGRKQTVAEAERALALCEELDISSQYTLITFHPEATAESMLADLEFAQRHPAHPLNYCRAEVYAGTPLERRLLDSGRALGDYFGRVYHYTDPRVERVWELGSELFAGRCWGKDEILGQAIRLDHQVNVVRHFYEGPAVHRLASSFRQFQVDLNLGTASLFRELVELCADQAVSSTVMARSRADLERRERRSRETLWRRLCAFRADVERCTRMAFPASVRPPPARPQRRAPNVVARHAAAVAVALGLAAFPAGAQGQAAGPQPTSSHRPGKERGSDAGERVEPPAVPHLDVGVAEEAPVPQRNDAGVAKAAAHPRPAPPDAGHQRRAEPAKEPTLKPPLFRNDIGVAEAAPPPYRNDIGVAEAAPPPWNPPPPPQSQAGWSDLVVNAPSLTVYLSDVGAVSGRVTVHEPRAPRLTFTVNGSTGDRLFQVTLTRRPAGGGAVALSISSEPKVNVHVDGTDLGLTPTVTPKHSAGRQVLTFEEPTSHARMTLSFTLAP